MASVDLLIFHRAPLPDDPPLTAFLQGARGELARRHARMFRRAGVDRVLWTPGPREAGRTVTQAREVAGSSSDAAGGFGDALAAALSEARVRRAVILSSGAVPRLRLRDARGLVATAAERGRRLLTNNRYSSDVCAVSDARALWEGPPLANDNALPRHLQEAAGFEVAELPGRQRLALDLDSPLDLAILALDPAARKLAGSLARGHDEAAGTDAGAGGRPAATALPAIPRLEEIRALAADPRRELLVFGRASSRTLAWLERHARCRVRFLAEERGFRAGSWRPSPGTTEAQHGGGPASAPPRPFRPPRATLGRLLAIDGPQALANRVAELADGALVDTRVLLADRLGTDEGSWPSPEDRYASDLLRADAIADPWLHALTQSAATAPLPILLGGHSLVGPGVRLLLAGI